MTGCRYHLGLLAALAVLDGAACVSRPSANDHHADAGTGRRSVQPDAGRPRCIELPCKVGAPCVRTFAGTGERGYQDGSALEARFTVVKSLALDAQARLYVLDLDNDNRMGRIRMIENGRVTTFAGDNGPLEGPAAAVTLDEAVAITFGPGGELFVIDPQRVRVITGGNVKILSMTPAAGAAPPQRLADIAAGSDGIYVADVGCTKCGEDHQPWIALLKDGVLTPLKDSAFEDQWFPQPRTVALGSDGAVYLPTGKGLRVIHRGAVDTITDYAVPWSSQADAIAVDAEGTVHGASTLGERVIRYHPGGELETIPPLGEIEKAINDMGCVDGPPDAARFKLPMDVAVDPTGQRIYVADSLNYRIRVIER